VVLTHPRMPKLPVRGEVMNWRRAKPFRIFGYGAVTIRKSSHHYIRRLVALTDLMVVLV